VTTLTDLPTDLPVPVDDGAAAHLIGLNLPSIPLNSTDGSAVDLATLSGRTVVFCYPRTGQPGQPIAIGWDGIPGARGCTPQVCSFRDLFRDLRAAGAAAVFGLSTQSPEYQKEAATRLQLPYALLSDADFSFSAGLRLPVFSFNGETLIKRLTMIVDDGRISKMFYPVFPPNQSAAATLTWLQENPIRYG
jgi:peroxiredoxin